MGHPWDNAVDRDTDMVLSSNRHGVGAVAPGTYLVGGRLGWCYPKTQSHNAW